MIIDYCLCFSEFDAVTQNWCDEADTERFLQMVSADVNEWTFIGPEYMGYEVPGRKISARFSERRPGWMEICLLHEQPDNPSYHPYKSTVASFKYDNTQKKITAFVYGSVTALYREKPVQSA